MIRRLLPLSLLLLVACTNPYTDHYVALSPASQTLPTPPGTRTEIRILPDGSADAESRAMIRRGFVMIGQSQFTGTESGRGDALSQGQAVGAQTVLLSQEYHGTRRGLTPVEEQVTVPVLRTYIDRTGAQRTGYVWTRSTVTRYQPTLYTEYTLTATFWKKGLPGGLGVAVQDPSDDSRHRNQTNKGAEVFAVVGGSPAFSADILDGDLITALDGRAIDTPQDFAALQSALAGRNGVRVDLLRDGRPLQKTVDLPAEVPVSTPTPDSPPVSTPEPAPQTVR